MLVAAAGWLALIAAFSDDVGSIGGPLDWLIQLLRVLTPVAAVGLLASAAWHLERSVRAKRRWTMIFGAFLLLLAGVVIARVTLVYHLYGLGMDY